MEFKSDTNDGDLVAAVVCMANASGGVILIGVGDHGEIVGAPPRHGSSTVPARLSAMIANRVAPAIDVTVQTVSIGNAEVIAIEVAAADSLVGTSDGHYSRRVLDVHGRPQCVPMQPSDIASRLATLRQADPSTFAVSEISIAALDITEIARFRASAAARGDELLPPLATEELLGALGLVTVTGDLTVGALLLFGSESLLTRHVPTHEVAFQVVQRGRVRVNRIERIPLLRAIDELTAAVGLYITEDEIEDGPVRIGLPTLTTEAVREVIANALVHRSFAVNGQVRVLVEDGNLTVSNPGGFPTGVTLENLLDTPPRPRNSALADAFKRAGIVERTGRGIGRIFHRQLSFGRPAPDYTRSSSEWVQVSLLTRPIDRHLALLASRARARDDELSTRELLLLRAALDETAISSKRVPAIVVGSPTMARATIDGLIERGLLTRSTVGDRSYSVAEGVRAQATTTPSRELDRFVEEIRTRGSVSRSEAAEVLRTSPEAASKILRQLVEIGGIEMRGQRRWTRYFVTDSAPKIGVDGR